MAVPVEEAIAALSTFSLEDDQPEVQGPAVWVSSDRGATTSPIEYSDVAAYRLSLSEDTKALNQLLPDSMKHSQAELYLETYQVLDLEMSRLREIQRWQASAASKLAADMQRFSRPERRINGPTVTHLWSMLKLLDVLVQLDHLKNAKASIPNDFSWYKRTFTQVSVQWQDTDSMREELDDLQIFLSTRWAILLNLHVEMFRVNKYPEIYKLLFLQIKIFRNLVDSVEDILQALIVFTVESLELDFALLFPDRHVLLRVLPVLVVLATTSEKDTEALYKRVKINRLIGIFKSDPVIPAFPDLHLSPAAIMKELSSYFPKFVSQARLLALPAPHELQPREAQEYPFIALLNHISAIRAEHDDFTVRFASSINQVVRYNYSAEERRALVELVGYVKSIGSMMQRCDTLVADALWETIHAEVQDFVQNTLATMLRTTFRRKKDLSRILSDMRTLSADWMANTSKQENDLPSLQQEGEESKGSYLYPRPAAPTAAQVHCLQFLIYEVVSGGNLRKPGGLFSNTGSDIPAEDLKQLETFFYKLGFFLHVLDYSVTIATLTDLGFLWFREFYLETSRVIQFPIECSLPWMLVDYVLESQNAGLFESVVMPFDIYNDASQQALTVLKQRFLYDEIEAELLGRSIDLRCLISQRMNKAFRENLEFLFDRFESQDICAIVELENLVNILKHAHKLLSEDLTIDSFSLIFSEMQENISLVSYSSRLAYQIWTEMQNDFLPNFILCNTTQRFVRSPKSSSARVQKPSMPYAKPNFYCGNQDLNSAHQSFTRLHNGFFGMPHMFSIVRLLGTRSLPWLIRALLDHISNKISSLEAMITGLQEALPKSIGLLPFDGGVTGCMRHIKEKLNWTSKAELKQEVLQGIKEIGSTLYWMGLLDIVLREVDTTRFMQLAPWLGFIPNADGQILLSQGEGESPVVNLMKSTTTAIVSNPNCSNPTSFYTMSKQAEAADLLYKANMNTGSVLEYALAFTSAALDKYCSKWSATPKTGFIDITTSKDFYRIFSGLQIVSDVQLQEHLEESVQGVPNSREMLGDSVAWGSCTLIYLLGQQLHFELFDFSYQVLNAAEVEVTELTLMHKNVQGIQGWEPLIEAMKKARRLNNHVFSMLKARCPLEDKVACAIKQSGTPLHRIKFENTVSAFETLPQKST
uniref:CYRIA/CYRIB Rac1 binding domain-containing protein n=1 Tax=Chenopodium quinoa TaxID=63459 RepID=A0A803KNN6_CHEQI